MSPLLLVAEHITHGIGTDFVFGLRSHGRPENIIPCKGKALALSHVSALVFMVLALQLSDLNNMPSSTLSSSLKFQYSWGSS